MLAIADSNGFFFAELVSDSSGHMSVKMTAENYCQGSAVNDFVEFKRDTFLVTVLESQHFIVITRAGGSGFFDSAKITKIKSVHAPCMTLGIEMVPGPRLNSNTFALIRDRRGIQLVNLVKGTSHQLIMSPVPV